MLESFLNASIIIGVLITLLWLYSVIITNVSIVDIFWGMGFVIVNTFYFLTTVNPSDRQIIVLLLVTIWGLRLSVYLGWRNFGKEEDYRYQEFRERYGADRYWWFSFFQVFLLQGALIVIVSLPLLAVHHSTRALNVLDYLAIIVWCVGFIFEAVGDYQLARFKKDSQNKGKVMNTGLWKYTRHPNYFGDATVWTAYALFCIASGFYWQIVGTVLMIWLIIKVSGVAMLEETLIETKPKYADYIKKTSAFFPRPPKK